MVWGKLGSTTLGSSASTMTASGTSSVFNNIIYNTIAASSSTSNLRLGNGSADSGSNYAVRYNTNGGTDGSGGSADRIYAAPVSVLTGEQEFVVAYACNKAGEEKLVMLWDIASEASGAGNAPARREVVGKWANTSVQFDNVQSYTNSGTYATDSNVTVLGSEGQTAVTAKIQDGLIFEETDTNKHYIYTASTDTWTEL